MRLVGILAAQTVLIFALDLSFDTRLCLWLLYFLPLLGTARLPRIPVTSYGAGLVSLLIVCVGFSKLAQTPWEEIFVPRALALYALGLTAVLLIRGKQFGVRAMHAVAEAGMQTHNPDSDSQLRKDLEIARHTLHDLSQQLHKAYATADRMEASRIEAEIEKLLGLLGERL